jgi:sulfofructose kinase
LSVEVDILGIGLNATDTLLLLDEFPSYAGKVPLTRELMSPGGQVATAVVTCARLGLRSRYIGTIGDDLKGQIQRESLEGTGVDTSGLIVRENCPNQTGYIMIDNRTGERTVLWNRSDCLKLKAHEIHPEDIAAAGMLHIDGCDTDAATYAASIAREHGIPVSLDVDTVYSNFEKVLNRVDYLVAGSDWPQRWTGEQDIFTALDSIQRAYSCVVTAMTLGINGALAYSAGVWHYSPGFSVHRVDTTGAGDTFHGAFCYGILKGFELPAALDFANAAAALNCTGLGARGHLPSLAEVNELLSDAENPERRTVAPEIAERAGIVLS